jgi:hypothetical protein
LEEKLSKLSEAVKTLQDEDRKKDIEVHFSTTAEDRDAFMKALYEKISNVEFNVYKSTDAFYIEVDPFMNFDKALVVRIKRARTTSYELGLFNKERKSFYVLGKYPIFVDAIGNDDVGYIDIGELIYYCEKIATEIPTEKSNLNKEIDEGFKNPKKRTDGSGRASLGGETLEEDIAFNEWMHKRYR